MTWCISFTTSSTRRATMSARKPRPRGGGERFEELLQIIKKVANANGPTCCSPLITASSSSSPTWNRTMIMPLPAAPNRTSSFSGALPSGGDSKLPASKLFRRPSWGCRGLGPQPFRSSLGRFPLQGFGQAVRPWRGAVSRRWCSQSCGSTRPHRRHRAGRDRTASRAHQDHHGPGDAHSLYQDRPTADKSPGRDIARGSLCRGRHRHLRTQGRILFDSGEAEARNREVGPSLLALSRAADAHNNQEVEIRLEELTAGNQSAVTYKVLALRTAETLRLRLR